MHSLLPIALVSLVVSAAAAPRFDEGMWTFENPPTKALKERYGFEPTAEWLEHVRLASVRFNSGGSASFVSPEGLVLTNHHVALDALHKLSTAERDFVKDGFHAQTRAAEFRCLDLELNVLDSLVNVTDRVKGAVKDGATAQEAEASRRGASAAIEEESKEATGLRSDVFALYAGGEYWLYRYKQYTDVRLVFAPEQQAGFFGGDPDNFTYPRYALDFAFFRVYENDAPAATPHYLRWNLQGPKEGELVFVSGHPGSTGRLNTYAQLEFIRDLQVPRTLQLLDRLRTRLEAYSARGEEEARQAMDMLFGVKNSQKAYTGYLAGLQVPEVMARKLETERSLREFYRKHPDAAVEQGDPWVAIETARRKFAQMSEKLSYTRIRGSLSDFATTIVRYVEETKKPNADRLPEFREAGLDSLHLQLFSEAPVYAGMDEVLLAVSLEDALEHLGPDDDFVKAALRGKTPAEAAKRLVAGSRLGDAAFRRQLVEGGAEAVAGSEDPMIVLARTIDPWLRELRKTRENEVDAVERSAGERIAKTRFAAFGRTMAPDANFTLRLSFGAATGYEEDTTFVPYKTTFYGLFERFHAFDGKPPFDLPPRYRDAAGKLDLATPMNFVSTCDIIGGNSGSPVVNARAELVGLIFDGNIQSLSNNYQYDDRDQRAVSVHSAAIIEVLRKLYGAADLVKEILGDRG